MGVPRDSVLAPLLFSICTSLSTTYVVPWFWWDNWLSVKICSHRIPFPGLWNRHTFPIILLSTTKIPRCHIKQASERWKEGGRLDRDLRTPVMAWWWILWVFFLPHTSQSWNWRSQQLKMPIGIDWNILNKSLLSLVRGPGKGQISNTETCR